MKPGTSPASYNVLVNTRQHITDSTMQLSASGLKCNAYNYIQRAQHANTVLIYIQNKTRAVETHNLTQDFLTANGVILCPQSRLKYPD